MKKNKFDIILRLIAPAAFAFFTFQICNAWSADEQFTAMASYKCGDFLVQVDKKGDVHIDDGKYSGAYSPITDPNTGLSNIKTTLQAPLRSKTDFSDFSDSVIDVSKSLLRGETTGTFQLNYAYVNQCTKQ